jgi:hypothetical protein
VLETHPGGSIGAGRFLGEGNSIPRIGARREAELVVAIA